MSLPSHNTNTLSQQCSLALAAFGLETNLAANFSLLKQDQISTVMRACCKENGIAKVFVLKRTIAGQYDSIAPVDLLARLETLLRAEQDLLLAEGKSTRRQLMPRLRHTADGQSFWYQGGQNAEEQFVWTVSEYIDNAPVFSWLEAPPSWQASHARNAGSLLADFHQASRRVLKHSSEIQSLDLAVLLPSILPTLPEALIQAFDAQSEQADAKHSTTQLFKSADKLITLKALEQALTSLTAGNSSSSTDDLQVIVHGDFHPGNVLFDGTKALAVIDIDYAHCENALYDIAYASIMFSPTDSTSDFARELLQGYKKQSTFDSALFDRETLNNYRVIAAVLILLWTLSPVGLEDKNSPRIFSRMIKLLADNFKN